MQIGEATMEAIRKITQKIRNWSVCSSSGSILKENKNSNLKKHMHPYVHCSIIYSNQDLEAI